MNEKLKFFHVTVFFYMLQVGLVLLRFPQIEATFFGTNGWLSPLICAAAAAVNIGFISLVHKRGRGRSIFEMMERAVPRIALVPLYLFVIAVWAMIASLAAKEYIHILQMVSFPTIPSAVFVFTLGALSYYLYSKGIRNLVKAATIFFFLTVWMTLLLLFFFSDFEWTRLTPFMFRDAHDMVRGFFDVYAAFLGYEISLLLFPYTDRKTKLIPAALTGMLSVTAVYTSISLVCFGVFSLEQLRHILFPVLDLLSAIKFPFMERIENLFYGFFLFANIVTTTAYYWAASITGERVAPGLNPRFIGALIILAAAGASMIPKTLMETEAWLRYFSYAEFGVAIGLPLLLLGCLLLSKNKDGASHDQA